MLKNRRNFYLFISILSVPFLTLASPSWIKFHGVSPSWEILWLLPISLKFGSILGIFSGLLIGISLDAISINGASHIPSLIFLGWWWGQLGKQNIESNLFFSFGVLAWIGTTFFGLSIWFQQYLINRSIFSGWFNTWSFSVLLRQAVITGLIAPLTCLWFLKALSDKPKRKI